jgi:hypothetical protein
MLERPVKRHHDEPCYDYEECRRYLEKRDGYQERDYAQSYRHGRTQEGVPTQDFWLFVCANAPDVSSDGRYIVMADWWKAGAEPWQQEILEKYLSTFGEFEPASGERILVLYVSW